MSFKALERVLGQSRQEGSARMLLLVLAHHADSQWVCWPTIASLASELRLEERQTQRLLRRLEHAGEIEVRGGQGGRGHPSCYLVTVGDPEIRWPEVLPGNGCSGLHRSRERVTSGDLKGVVQDAERVYPGTEKGVTQGSAYKESELTIELKGSSVNGRALVPVEVQGFDAELRGLPGYEPTKSFFERVVANYAGLDLVEEAIAIRDWFGRPSKKFKRKTPAEAGEVCSNSRVLRWLKRAKGQEEAGSDDPGAAFRGAGRGPAGDGGAGGATAPRLEERWDV